MSRLTEIFKRTQYSVLNKPLPSSFFRFLPHGVDTRLVVSIFLLMDSPLSPSPSWASDPAPSSALLEYKIFGTLWACTEAGKSSSSAPGKACLCPASYASGPEPSPNPWQGPGPKHCLRGHSQLSPTPPTAVPVSLLPPRSWIQQLCPREDPVVWSRDAKSRMKSKCPIPSQLQQPRFL